MQSETDAETRKSSSAILTCESHKKNLRKDGKNIEILLYLC